MGRADVAAAVGIVVIEIPVFTGLDLEAASRAAGLARGDERGQLAAERLVLGAVVESARHQYLAEALSPTLRGAVWTPVCDSGVRFRPGRDRANTPSRPDFDQRGEKSSKRRVERGALPKKPPLR